MGGDGTDKAAGVAEAMAFARRFVAVRYPAAQAALLAGSRARGEGRPDSDYDLFLLFDRDATWGPTAPRPVSSGATVIGDSDRLAASAAALLR